MRIQFRRNGLFRVGEEEDRDREVVGYVGLVEVLVEFREGRADDEVGFEDGGLGVDLLGDGLMELRDLLVEELVLEFEFSDFGLVVVYGVHEVLCLDVAGGEEVVDLVVGVIHRI